MMKKNGIIITAILLSFVLSLTALTGCSKNDTVKDKDKNTQTSEKDEEEEENRTVFKYKNPDKDHDLILKKTVLEDGKLTIYYDYDEDVDKESYVLCFDENGEEIPDNKYSFKINDKKGTIEIKYKKADLINGIEFHPDEYNDISFKIRYLQSDDYAILTTLFVCDLGYEDIGDEDKYLFESEKKEIEENQKRAAEEYEESYELIKGMWASIDNNDYVLIEKDDTGRLVLEYHFLDDYDVTQTDIIYCESLGIYGENSETGGMEFYASTGNMTAPVYINLFDNGTRLSFSYSIDDAIFEKVD